MKNMKYSILLFQLTRQYDKTMFIGDFDLTINNKSLENFMSTFDLECLIKKSTCFQYFEIQLV